MAGEESPLIGKEVAPVPPPLPTRSCTLSGLTMNGMPVRGYTCVSTATRDLWECLFNDCYRADVSIITENGGVIYAHASILGVASPVLKGMLKKSRRQGRRRSISICGVPHDAVRVFIRFLYSASFEPEELQKYVLNLLVLSHAYVVPHLKRLCEWRLEHGLLTIDNVIDTFQLALLCDAPRLSLICYRMILKNFKSISTTEAWKSCKRAIRCWRKKLWNP